MSEKVEIDVTGRWDAIALLQRLSPYRAYLIQYGPRRWLVHAEAPGYKGEPLPMALAAIDECLLERRVKDAAVRVDGRDLVEPQKRHAHDAAPALR